MGVTVRDLTRQEAMAGYQGVVVTKVEPEGLASEKLVVGDLIESVNQINVSNSIDFYRHLAASAAAQATSIQLIRQRKRGRVTLAPSPRHAEENGMRDGAEMTADGVASPR